MRFLLAAVPAAGHIGPLLPVAAELRDRGHDVLFMTGHRYRTRVEAVGAAWVPFVHTRDMDFGRLDDELPGRADHKGVARLRFDLREVFIAMVPAQVADLELRLDQYAPDALISDPAFGAASRIVDERHGLPWATCGITAITMPSCDTAPFGTGLRPPRTAAARAVSRAAGAAMNKAIFRGVEEHYHAMTDRMGVRPVAGGLFAEAASPYLYLQPTVPAFEYPRRDLPQQVRFVGPLLPPVPPAAELPAWWEQVTGSARKVVLVTQGTISTDPSELLRPALQALAREPVHVIAVTGGPDPAEVGPVPANAHVERFVPFGPLMPHLSAMVTNGGYGGLHFAMSHGVPVVVAGATEDKPELLQRVRFSGVGVGMRTQSPKPERLRRAVRRVLEDPRFARRAHEMAAEMAAHRGPATSADLVEELAARHATPLGRPGAIAVA